MMGSHEEQAIVFKVASLERGDRTLMAGRFRLKYKIWNIFTQMAGLILLCELLDERLVTESEADKLLSQIIESGLPVESFTDEELTIIEDLGISYISDKVVM